MEEILTLKKLFSIFHIDPTDPSCRSPWPHLPHRLTAPDLQQSCAGAAGPYTREARNSKPQVGCESTQARRQQWCSLQCRKPTAKCLVPANAFWIPIFHRRGVKQQQSITPWHLGEYSSAPCFLVSYKISASQDPGHFLCHFSLQFHT